MTLVEVARDKKMHNTALIAHIATLDETPLEDDEIKGANGASNPLPLRKAARQATDSDLWVVAFRPLGDGCCLLRCAPSRPRLAAMADLEQVFEVALPVAAQRSPLGMLEYVANLVEQIRKRAKAEAKARLLAHASPAPWTILCI